MRRVLACVSLVILMATFSTGCAGVSGGAFGGGTPVGGWVYTGVTVPSQRLHAPLDENVSSARVGMASVLNVLGLVGVNEKRSRNKSELIILVLFKKLN